MASMMPFLGAAAGNAMQAYDQTNYRNKMMDLQKSRLDQSNRLDERRMDLTEQELAARKEQAEKQELKDVISTFISMNEMTSDADRPKLVEQFNSTVVPRFSKYGLVPISSLNRKGKMQYDFKTASDGNTYALGVSDQGAIEIKPVTLPSGAPFSEQEKPISVRDNEMLMRPGSGEKVYTGPRYGEEKQETPQAAKWFTNPQTGETMAFDYNNPPPAGWTPSTERTSKPEMTPGQALLNIRRAEEAKVRAGKTSVVDQLLANAYGLKEGAPLDDDTKKRIAAAADEEIAYYRQFAPGGQATKPKQQSVVTDQVTPDVVAGALKGKPANRRYRVGGKIYVWDGTTATPE